MDAPLRQATSPLALFAHWALRVRIYTGLVSLRPGFQDKMATDLELTVDLAAAGIDDRQDAGSNVLRP